MRIGQRMFVLGLVVVLFVPIMIVTAKAAKGSSLSATEITGKILTLDGKAAKDAALCPYRQNKCISVKNGAFQFEYVTPVFHACEDARYSLSFDGRKLTEIGVLVLAESGYAKIEYSRLIANPDITLSPWSSVEGVLNVGAKPLPFADIRLDYSTVPNSDPAVLIECSTQTDANGYFRIKHAVTGRAMLSHVFNTESNYPGNATNVVVTVRPGKNKFDIGGNGRTIIGKLIFPSDVNNWSELVSRSYVSRRPQGTLKTIYDLLFRSAQENVDNILDSMHDILIKPDGSFVIENVTSGEYNVTFGFYAKPLAIEQLMIAESSITVLRVKPADLDTPIEMGIINVKKIGSIRIRDVKKRNKNDPNFAPAR